MLLLCCIFLFLFWFFIPFQCSSDAQEVVSDFHPNAVGPQGCFPGPSWAVPFNTARANVELHIDFTGFTLQANGYGVWQIDVDGSSVRYEHPYFNQGGWHLTIPALFPVLLNLNVGLHTLNIQRLPGSATSCNDGNDILNFSFFEWG
jgi:hypothetical protein